MTTQLQLINNIIIIIIIIIINNAEYYKGVLDRLISRIRRVRPALYRTRDFFLLHDKAPAHSAAEIPLFLTQKQLETLNHPHTRQTCLPLTASCSRR